MIYLDFNEIGSLSLWEPSEGPHYFFRPQNHALLARPSGVSRAASGTGGRHSIESVVPCVVYEPTGRVVD